jgi:single-strand DNA-binding protein
VAADIKKGTTVLVEGRLTQDRWQDKQTGQNRYKLKVTAESIQALGAPQAPGRIAEAPVEKNLDDVQF